MNTEIIHTSLRFLVSMVFGMFQLISRHFSRISEPVTRQMSTAIVNQQQQQQPLILIASLGNPSEYDGSRHSVGHYMLQQYTRSHDCEESQMGKFKFYKNYPPPPTPIPSPTPSPPLSPKLESIGGEEQLPKKKKKNKQPKNQGLHQPCEIWFYRTPGFMNLSGKSLLPFYTQFHNYAVKNDLNPILVILFDELDLNLGKIKTRKQNSSHRGHNGLRSIQERIGKEYTGVQIGIGRDYSGDKNTPGVVADYVLSKFKPNEKEILDEETFPQLEKLIDEMRRGKYIYEKLK